MTHADLNMDFLGACVIWALEYPEAIIYEAIDGSAAHTAAERGRSALHQIVGGRMVEPRVVAIGGKRGGVAVVVEVDETLPNKAKLTQMRAEGRPQQPWLWRSEGKGMIRDSRFAYWRERKVRLTAAREARVKSIGIFREAVYSQCLTSRMTVGERLWPFRGRTYK